MKSIELINKTNFNKQILKVLNIFFKILEKEIKNKKFSLVIKMARLYLKITILKQNIFFKNIFNIYKILTIIFVLKKNKYKVSDVLYKDLKINLKKLVPNINLTNEIYMPISKEKKKVDFGIEFKFRF